MDYLETIRQLFPDRDQDEDNRQIPSPISPLPRQSAIEAEVVYVENELNEKSPIGDERDIDPIDLVLSLPKAQVEMAETVNDKFGITDPDHRRYNVLSWVRGYYQFRDQNHGEHYEAILHEFKRLSRILDEKGIG